MAHNSQRKLWSKRSVLKSTVALSGAVAGCSGQKKAKVNKGDGGDSGQTQGPQTTATTSEPSMDTPEEWREVMAQRAKKELEGEKLQIMVEPGGIKTLEKLFNGYDAPNAPGNDPPIKTGSIYEVLKDKVSLNPLDSPTQAQKYRREVQAGMNKTDILTTNKIPIMVSQKIPFFDHSGIPGWQNKISQRLQDITNRIVWTRTIITGGIYSPDALSVDHPKAIDDFLASRFEGKTAVDVTPSPVVYVPFLSEKWRDKVPPQLKAVGMDMTGLEFVKELSNKSPNLVKNSYTMTKKVGQADYPLAWMGSISLMYDFNSKGLNIKMFDHPSAHVLRASPAAIAETPPHPAAAQLFIDYWLNTPKVQVGRPGTMSIDFERSNPPELKEKVAAEWQQLLTPFDFQDPTAILDEVKEIFGVPSA